MASIDEQGMNPQTTGFDPSEGGDDLRRRVPPQEQFPAFDFGQEVEKSKDKPLYLVETWNSIEWFLGPILLTLISLFTRIYRIGLSPTVTWDEAHFGKFGSHYLKREFYFDVHPPLGKMLVGLSGYIAGYNGSFEFKSGDTYPEGMNYTSMRIFNSSFGAALVPLAYFTAKELKLSRSATWLISLMVLFDNSYATISRFILLDSMLLFFTFTTIFCWAKFHQQRHDPLGPEWGLWLMLTGASIGCVTSVKMVGLFCTALIGIYTVEDLWRRFGDLKVPKGELAADFFFRVFALILIPFSVYFASFYLHFQILENSGPGDAQMSSLFQANLRGTSVGKNSPLEVAIGSRVTVKNMGYGGGLLHSHVQTYPDGSGQQQVTCYHHKDSNNDWFIYPNRGERDYDPEDDEVRHIGHGDVIRLIHAQTGRNLHSHKIAAPVTKGDWEVSSYGNTTVGDSKDHWLIEVVDDVASRDHSRLRTLTTAFRLKHPDLGCYLRAGNVNLPQWGFKQIEVTCAKANNPRDKYTHWNIEAHKNDKLPPSDPGSYKSPLWRDFIHLNVAMITSNNALVPDPDKQDDLASAWWEWPLLFIGRRLCSWDDKTVKYFLLGNPLVYWGSSASLVFFVGLVGWYLVRWQRGFIDLTETDVDQIHYVGLYPLLGWALHYLPFGIMARVTYFHHYFPALYFAIIIFGFSVDWVFPSTVAKGSVRYYLRPIAYTLLYVGITGLFWHFRDITFGMQGSSTKWKYLAWFKSWEVSK